jgi:uncharacterized cupin superfamily protein
MPRIDLARVPVRTGSIYPEPYASQMRGRSSLRLGEGAGLTQFGVNMVTLEPGAKASLRHWHLKEDEFAIVLEGELILVEEGGETAMQPGDCAAWKAGMADGHRLINRSGALARFLVVGTHAPDEVVTYADVDLVLHAGADGSHRFTHRDGSPFGERG